MQFVSWLSGHSDYTWLRRMSVLSMRSSGAGVNPAVTLNELQDRCNLHQRRMLTPLGRLIRTFRKIEPSANCVAVGEDLPTTPDFPVRGMQPV
jgi:hypothetical protein